MKEKKNATFNEFSMNFDKLEELMDDLVQELMSRQKDGNNKAMIMGFTIRITPENEAEIVGFDNLQGDTAMKTQTALTQVEENKKSFVITAEMPGVQLKDITVNLTGKILEMKSKKPIPYLTKVNLPKKIMKPVVNKQFKNGVLEITIKK